MKNPDSATMEFDWIKSSDLRGVVYVDNALLEDMKRNSWGKCPNEDSVQLCDDKCVTINAHEIEMTSTHDSFKSYDLRAELAKASCTISKRQIPIEANEENTKVEDLREKPASFPSVQKPSPITGGGPKASVVGQNRPENSHTNTTGQNDGGSKAKTGDGSVDVEVKEENGADHENAGHVQEGKDDAENSKDLNKDNGDLENDKEVEENGADHGNADEDHEEKEESDSGGFFGNWFG